MRTRILLLCLISFGALAATDIAGGLQPMQPAYPSLVPAVCATAQTTGSSGQLCLFGSLTSAGYNPLVQANDVAMIFNGGSSGTGSLFIGPHSASSYGLRMTAAGASAFGGTLTSSGLFTASVNSVLTGLVGIGRTPTTFRLEVADPSSGYNSAQFGVSSPVFIQNNSPGLDLNIYNTGAGYKYAQNGYGGIFQYNPSGQFEFDTAANNVGGAGAAATFLQAMTIGNTGGIVVPAPSGSAVVGATVTGGSSADGIDATAGASGNYGVYGLNNSTAGGTAGIFGQGAVFGTEGNLISGSSAVAAVYGNAISKTTSFTFHGVKGDSGSTTGYGGWFRNSNGGPGGLFQAGATAGGTSTSAVLSLQSYDASTQSLNFYNNLPVSSQNPAVVAGDEAIVFSDGSSGTGSLFIGPANSSASGIRLTSAGSLLSYGTSSVIDFSGSGGTMKTTTGTFIIQNMVTEAVGDSAAFDLSNGSGAFKTTTGAFSSGASSNTFTNSVGIGAASLSNMRLLVADPSLGDGDVQIGTAYPLVLRTNYPGLGFNEYYNGTHEVYVATNYAGQIQFDNSGNMNFKTAPSGSAAATATMTTRLSIANTGAVAVAGSLQVGGGTVSSNLYHGTCTLNAASPSVCTATVASTSTCVATARGTTAAAGVGLATSISSTTLTITGPNGSSLVVGYICL